MSILQVMRPLVLYINRSALIAASLRPTPVVQASNFPQVSVCFLQHLLNNYNQIFDLTLLRRCYINLT